MRTEHPLRSVIVYFTGYLTPQRSISARDRQESSFIIIIGGK
jgi:hypothetical protein